MANIREYTSDINDLQPQETAARLTAQEASHQASAGNEFGAAIGEGVKAVGDVGVKYATYQDTTALAGKSATLLADKMQEWNQIAKNSDPNDPTVAADFLKNNLQPALDKLRESAWTDGGQQYAGNQADSIFAHITQVTAADMAQKAGQGAITAVAQTANALSVAAANDPAGVDKYLGMLDAAVAAIVKGNPSLDVATATKLHDAILQTAKEGLVKSAVQAAIQANPDEGVKLAAKPALAPYINGAEVKQFDAYARANKRAEDTDRRQNEADDRRKAEQRSQDAIGNYESKLYDDNGNFAPPKNFTKTILNDAAILPKDKGPFLSMVNRLAAQGNAKSDTDGLVNHLLIAAAGGSLTPADVYQYVGAGNPTGKQLTQTSANFVLSALKGSADEKRAGAILADQITSAQRDVAPIDSFTRAFTAADGAKRSADLATAAQLAYMEGKKQGVSSYDLLTPGRPGYIFTKDFLDQFRKSTATSGGILTLPPPVSAGSPGKAGGRVNENAPPVPAPPPPLPTKTPAATPAPAATPPSADTLPPDPLGRRSISNGGVDLSRYSTWASEQPAGADKSFGAYQKAQAAPPPAAVRPSLGDIAKKVFK